MFTTDYTTKNIDDEKARYLERYYQGDFSDTLDNLNKAIFEEMDKEAETASQEEEENKYDAQAMMLEKLQCIAKKKMLQGISLNGKIRRGYPMTLIRRELHGAYSRKSQRPRTFRGVRLF